ncbi:MAG: hypothetical protein NWQ54_14165 [Paraglaciecola sp.]|nr:hypothetical protein [Paraglaciecola sp.]
MELNQETIELVGKIVAFNHCWKLAQSRFGSDSAISRMLRDQKSVLQCALLRQKFAYLQLDEGAIEEALYSVRLFSSVNVNGVKRNDAEHMPVRIASELLTEEELQQFEGK